MFWYLSLEVFSSFIVAMQLLGLLFFSSFFCHNPSLPRIYLLARFQEDSNKIVRDMIQIHKRLNIFFFLNPPPPPQKIK